MASPLAPAGRTFRLGALLAIAAAALATFVAAPAVHRAIDLGERVEAAGAGAPAEDLAAMERAEAMAVARYLG
jgi:hypothetical protein